MPHNLAVDTRTGKIMMASSGEPPWHGLGKKLDGPATSAEAIQAAGLDWEIVKEPLHVLSPAGSSIRVPDRYALLREDCYQMGVGPVFGVVSNEYHPLQNREAFDFFDEIVGRKEAIYHTAGALGQGEKVWILAKLPGEIQVIGDDICDKYLLLSNGHDGQTSVQVKFTPIRVVCQNTLNLALRRGPTLHISHTRNVRERLRQAEDLLGIVKASYSEISLAFEAMARAHLDPIRLGYYYEVVFPDPRNVDDKIAWQRVQRDRRLAGHLYEIRSSESDASAPGTLWLAYNSVTEYIDYRNPHLEAERRLNTIWFGKGAQIKQRAFQVALELL